MSVLGTAILGRVAVLHTNKKGSSPMKAKRFTAIALAVLVLATLTISVLALRPQTAQAATITHPMPSCAVLLAHPHGTAPATFTCLQPVHAGVKPQLGDCGLSSIALFWDANYEGAILCFDTAGFYNLASYWTYCNILSGCINWANEMSSFIDNACGGHFSYFPNNGKPYYYFSPIMSVPYVGSFWNDETVDVNITFC